MLPECDCGRFLRLAQVNYGPRVTAYLWSCDCGRMRHSKRPKWGVSDLRDSYRAAKLTTVVRR